MQVRLQTESVPLTDHTTLTTPEYEYVDLTH